MKPLNDKKKKLLAALGIALFVGLSGLICWLAGPPIIDLVSNPERLRAWVEQVGPWSRLAFVGMVVLQIVVAVIPGEPLEIAAGFAFGALEGTLLCLAGIVIGSALVFALVRKFGMRAVQVFFSREKLESVKFLQNTRRLTLITFIVFFIPGTPKDILSYIVGLTPMKFGTWLLISGIARIPSVVTSTVGGDALGAGNLSFAVMVFAATLVVSALGLLVYRRICKLREKTAEER